MTTELDLKVSLNAEVGSIPLSLDAEVKKGADSDVYTFDGSIQDADINLKDFFEKIAIQFGVDLQLPPELELELIIEYLVGQIIVTKPTTGTSSTDLGVSGKFKFEFTRDGKKENLEWQFFAASKLEGKEAQTTLADTGTTKPYVVGFALNSDMEFSDLPVVGKIPGFNDLVLKKIGFSYTNDKSKEGVKFGIPTIASSPNPLYTRKEAPDAKEAKVYSIESEGADKKLNVTKGGFSLTVGLENKYTGELASNFALPLALQAKKPTQKPFPKAKLSPAKSPVHWIDINKTFGPVDLKKIGLNYAKGEASFGFTASFALGGFTLDLEGLSITFPLPLPGQAAGNEVSFDLQGLSLDFKKGGLEIGGGFLKVVQDEIINYYGEVIVKAGTFGFKAIGGYAPDADPASFFIYANIDIPLGGPPFLFVTGLAGGFGINRTLILPTMETLPVYPLLPHNAPKPETGGTPEDTFSQVLPELAYVFQNKPGEYWVAAGIQFTSFEMIDAFALLTVSFGVDFQLGLLGVCSMTLPKGDPVPLAYVEIDIVASLTPSIGLFSIDGRLSPASFIYAGLVHISGGFAFYIWFAKENKGQFVVSLGGYHPAFDPPKFYPKVPRLEMTYGLGPLKMGGKAYFALTPAFMMAGIEIYATFSAGPVKAWFDAGVDFLLGWAPFHYQAGAFIHIGVSVDLKLFSITVHVGVDLSIWGPEFGGVAHIDLDVVSFSIHFGAPQAPPPAIGWKTFKEKFLPKNTPTDQKAPPTPLRAIPMLMETSLTTDPAPTETVNIINAAVSKGLIKSNVEGYDWVVDPNHFEITTNSTIPANNGIWNPGSANEISVPNDVTKYYRDGGPPPKKINSPFWKLGKKEKVYADTHTGTSFVWAPSLNIGPMKEKNIKSYHQVSLTKEEHDGSYTPISDFSIQPSLLGSASAQWGVYKGNSKNPNDPKDALIDFTLVGLLISPIPRNPDTVSNVLLENLIFQQDHETQFFYTKAAPDSSYEVSDTITDDGNTLNMKITGAATETFVDHNFILSTLDDTWVVAKRASILDALQADGFDTYTSEEVNLEILSTKKALTDWPMVKLLGE